MRIWGERGAKTVAALLVVATVTACATTPAPAPAPLPSASPPPGPPPPPVDLAGKWRFSAASGGACVMTFGAAPGAAEGTIAPAGGCPGNFFTSRKWAFERGALIIRNHKGETLAQLSFAGGQFQGQGTDGSALSLSR